MWNFKSIVCALLLLPLGWQVAAADEKDAFLVVTSIRTQFSALTEDQLVQVFVGRLTKIGNQEITLVLPQVHMPEARLLEQLTGMPIRQLYDHYRSDEIREAGARFEGSRSIKETVKIVSRQPGALALIPVKYTGMVSKYLKILAIE